MSFKFNFSSSAEPEIPDDKDADSQDNQQEPIECEEIFVTNQINQLGSIAERAKMLMVRDFEIAHVIPSDVLTRTKESAGNILVAECQHSDLISGVYEGGLKIWECTSDLLEYLIDNPTEVKFENANVLDLGCGAGLLGIYSQLQGANVTFQDYNKEVIEHVTIPNIILNCEEKELDINSTLKKCRFFFGDWHSFNSKLEMTLKFDIILTSETIYNPKSYLKLCEIFENRLEKDGVIFVASKTHYFGVGGGLRQFEKVLDKKMFTANTCWNSLGGVQREILKIKRIA